MPHDASLITTLATGLGLAMIMGLLASRLKLPPLVGYLIAGIIIGPGTHGFVADIDLARQLADIGVMLLMFGVGLHLSLDDLLSVRRISLPGALIQVMVATVLGGSVALLWGWSAGAALVFGLALSCASTVVLLRSLEDRGLGKSINGQIAVGWLVAQDLIMVLALVLLPGVTRLLETGSSAGSAHGIWITIAITFGKIAAFVAFMIVVGRRLFPRVLFWVAGTGSRELFTLCVIAVALGVAFLSARAFDVSFALGAFFAGMMMRESEFSHRAARESLPLREAFSVLFFVSIGMLLDPQILMLQPLRVLAVVGVIMLANPLTAIVLILVFRYPLSTALTVGAGLAQIGEFSFILASLGVSMKLLSLDGQSMILAGALISIALNSFLFSAVEPLVIWLREHSRIVRYLERRHDPLAQLPVADGSRPRSQVVLIGYGRVGRRIADALMEHRIPFVVAEQNRDLVEVLRARAMTAIFGDAADPAVLQQAQIERAGILVLAIPDTFDVRRIADIARQLNPGIEIVLRTHSDEEAELLQKENVGKVFMGEHELALGMAEYVVARTNKASEHV